MDNPVNCRANTCTKDPKAKARGSHLSYISNGLARQAGWSKRNVWEYEEPGHKLGEEAKDHKAKTPKEALESERAQAPWSVEARKAVGARSTG